MRTTLIELTLENLAVVSATPRANPPALHKALCHEYQGRRGEEPDDRGAESVERRRRTADGPIS